MRAVMIVTGGGRGIGAATAVAAAHQGFNVCVTYRADEAAAQAVVAECERAGSRAIPVRAEVSDPDDIERLFSTVAAELGPVEALVNNAGIAAGASRLDDLPVDRIERMFRVNVLGTFLCCQAAVRQMSTRYGGRGGAIVNVSSRAAVLGSPGEYVDYAASKAAVDALTTGLAKEVAAEGIRVNAVRPGLIHTDIHVEQGRVDRLSSTVPMLRGGQPEEVAAAILWLVSAEASYVTGAFLDVSGGR